MKVFAFEVTSLTVIPASEMGSTVLLPSSNSKRPMSAMGPFPVWKRLNPLTAGGTGPSPWEIEAVRRSNLPAMCLISWHTTERGGSGPFTRLNLILIHIASLLSVARKRQNRSDAALSFASLLRRLFHLSAPMHFPMRPTSKLLHIATPQPK